MSRLMERYGLALMLLVGGMGMTQAAADPLADARALEDEVSQGCLRDLNAAQLTARVAKLRTAFAAKPETLIREAPVTMLSMARLARMAPDYARARTELRALLKHLPEDSAEHSVAAAEMEAIELEEQGRKRGLTPPAAGWILAEDGKVPLPGVARAEVAIWSGPPCSVMLSTDDPHRLVFYVQPSADRTFGAVGEPVSSDEQLLLDAESSNQDVTGAGATIVAVTSTSGGNCWACDRLRLFRAEVGGLRELPLPDSDIIVAKRVEELPGGPPVVIATDVRWEEFGDVCHACAPGSLYYYRWERDHFAEACNQAADRYRQSRAEAAAALAKEKESADYAFGYAVSRLLDGLQLGLIDQAWAELETDLMRVRSLPKTDALAYLPEEKALRQAIDRARATMPARACPLLDLELSED